MRSHPARTALLAPLAIAMLTVGPALLAQDADRAATLAGRAARYVEDYEQRLTGIVGEERQTQRRISAGGVVKRQRELVSDVLLVRIGKTSYVFRDVIAVDGKPVRNRQERLQKLFVNTSRTAIQQSQAISRESRRYDIGVRILEFTGALTLPLRIMTPIWSERFRFAAADDGVMFEEVRSPTLYRSRQGLGGFHDMPLGGRLRIEEATGAIRAATVTVSNDHRHGSVEIRYMDDPSLGLLVPADTHETYRRPPEPKAEYLDVTSAYSNFRRFEVTVDEHIDLPN